MLYASRSPIYSSYVFTQAIAVGLVFDYLCELLVVYTDKDSNQQYIDMIWRLDLKLNACMALLAGRPELVACKD